MVQVLPWLLLVLYFLSYFYWRGIWEDSLRSDSAEGGAGFFENATVVVLIGGILCGLITLIRFRDRLPNKLFVLWIAGWTLACIYFAGEEVSWGQWFFRWETPEAFQQVNKQQETNLHNTSSWLNEKPRSLVEIWMILAGLVFPLIAATCGKWKAARTGFFSWLFPGALAVSIVLCFCLLKVMGYFKAVPWCLELGNSEIREFFIAAFLSLYLVWVFFRSRRRVTVPSPAEEGDAVRSEPILNNVRT